MLLPHNSLFCEHFILLECQPGITVYQNLKSALTAKANNRFGFVQYFSYLLIKINCFFYHIGLTINLSSTPTANFDHQLTKDMKSL